MGASLSSPSVQVDNVTTELNVGGAITIKNNQAVVAFANGAAVTTNSSNYQDVVAITVTPRISGQKYLIECFFGGWNNNVPGNAVPYQIYDATHATSVLAVTAPQGNASTSAAETPTFYCLAYEYVITEATEIKLRVKSNGTQYVTCQTSYMRITEVETV